MATKTEQGQKQGLWGKIQDWYAQPGIQMAVGMVYSIGAAVVIVGALFKIMHWPGAGVMLTAGMMTEAILFTIGVFEKPHATYHWEHVFPSLVEDEAKPLNISGNIGGGVGVAMPGMEKMSDEDAKKLTESIKNMSETAAQLANISRVAGLTDSYANNLQKASEAAAQFATKQQNLDEATNALLSSYKGIADNMIAAEDKTKSFAEKASELSKNLGSINTSYELQLKGIQSQAAAIENQSNKINAVTAEFEKLHNAVSASSKNMDAYKQMTDQLAKNVSDLNNVYGNMLNAIKA
ncbi:MAG: gliding motility protein GldL [Paludibacteraceae bacterium]|jgi:gliding motility-associated protein GldL|nr:gliding motility protein GldL [Paludibacteraceae bacterium]